MTGTRQIGRWDAISVIMVTICTQIFLNLPRLASETSGTAGWLMLLYSGTIAFALFALISALYRKYDGMNLFDIINNFSGRPLLILIGLIYAAYLIFAGMITLREFSENLKTISLADSPLSFVSLFFLASIVLGSYSGINTLGKISAIAVPAIIAAVIFIGISASQFSDVSRIMPILGLGPKSIFLHGVPRVSVFSGISVLFLLADKLKTSKTFSFVGFWSLGVSIVFIVFSTFIYLTVFSYPTSNEYFLPSYMLARIINYGRFFQRIESLFLLIWVFGAFLYMSIAFYFAAFSIQKSFGMESHRPLIPSLALIVYSLSFIPDSLISSIKLETDLFRNFAGIITYGLTILVLLLAALFGKKKKEVA